MMGTASWQSSMHSHVPEQIPHAGATHMIRLAGDSPQHKSRRPTTCYNQNPSLEASTGPCPAPPQQDCCHTITSVRGPTLGGDGSCCAGRCTTGGIPRCCLALPRGSPSEPVRLVTAALFCCCCGCCCCCCRGAFWLCGCSVIASLAAWAGTASSCRATEASGRTLCSVRRPAQCGSCRTFPGL